MSLALAPTPKPPRQRTVEEILGPRAVADLVGLDLQHRQERLSGEATIEIHYNDMGRRGKVKVRALRVFHVLPHEERDE